MGTEQGNVQMAKRGRKPIDPQLKVVRGTFRKDRHNPDAPEFETLTGPVEPPAWMTSGEATEEWKRLVSLLESQGVLTEADLTMLAVLCHQYGEYVANVREGKAIPGAVLSQIRMLYSEFGLTPAARRNIKAPGGPSGNDFANL